MKRAFHSLGRYEIDADQELIGLGLANMLGSLFSTYPVRLALFHC
jgi:MFS superfamily sulfate permease-like transporter